MGGDAARHLCSHQVLITESRYRELEEAERKLTALEDAGVHRWDGYVIAMEGCHWDAHIDF